MPDGRHFRFQSLKAARGQKNIEADYRFYLYFLLLLLVLFTTFSSNIPIKFEHALCNMLHSRGLRYQDLDSGTESGSKTKTKTKSETETQI